MNPLSIAVSECHLGAVITLLNNGANIDLYKRYGRYGSPLSMAIDLGYDEIAHCLIDHGADVNLSGGLGYRRPLDYATYKQSVDIVRHLLSKGADPTLTDSCLFNAIDRAIASKNKEIIEMLNS